MEFVTGPHREASDVGHLNGDLAGLAGDTALNQAKGLLMFRYGIGSHEALALLLQWSRRAGSDVGQVVTTLLDEVRRGAPGLSDSSDLAQWLDDTLRQVLSGQAR